MNAIVFCGPSITAEDARAVLPDAQYRGPAACGDVYRAARERPQVIALCDGYFDHRLSVWHKEILWALAHGSLVYGAASMGALRAAELCGFGMVGVGRVFEQYRDGALDSDDEVAVVHDSEANGYRPLSEALVNIRATLDRAIQERVLVPAAAARWAALAKRLFYPDRSFEALFSRAAAFGIPEQEVAELKRWLLKRPVVNQKRLDAFALLARVRADLETRPRLAAECPQFHFEHTNAWDVLQKRIDREALAAVPKPAPSPLGTSPQVWAQAQERALSLLLADEAAAVADADAVQRESEAFRRARGLHSPEQTAEWLSSNDLDLKLFSLLMYEEHLAARFRSAARERALAQVDNVLRLNGEYAARGADKEG